MQVRVVEFFGGCGGTSLGFAMARHASLKFKVMGGLELDPHAAATFRNALGAPVHVGNILELRDASVFERIRQPWEGEGPLVVIGCAPCQGFSSHRKKDKRADARNSLLAAFAEIAVTLDPEVIVMENVPEMLSAKHWEHFDEWTGRVRAAGYNIQVAIHNLAEFGVPQERYRALVIAAKWKHFTMPKPILDPGSFRTVRNAIAHLPPLAAGGVDDKDPMHITSRHRQSTVDLLRQIPKDGGSRRSLPAGVGPSCWDGVDGFRDVYGRLWWDRPSVAITARCRTPSCGRFVHPEQDRGLSVREAALLQGFPEDLYFEGPFDDKFKQIGNAVSPVFAKAIAEHLANEWFADHEDARRTHDSPGFELPLSKSFSSSIAHLKRSRDRVSAV